MSSRLSWFSGKQYPHFPVNSVKMPWWITCMEIKRSISQRRKIRYLHKPQCAFSSLHAMICSLKHSLAGHLVVLMEKVKYVLLKTQLPETGQFKDYSFRLSEVLNIKAEPCVPCCSWAAHPSVEAQRWDGMQEVKSQPNKNLNAAYQPVSIPQCKMEDIVLAFSRAFF